MDTNRLKRFATEARNKLMQGVAHRLMALGFHPDGSATEEPQLQGGGATFMGGIVSVDFYQKWNSLQHAVQMRSIDEIVEEAAYTWFNRLMAIQIMVRNRLISPVLDFDESGARVPVIVAEARQGRCPQMDSDTDRQLNALIDDDRKTDEQFALLITAFCHSNPVIYSCFGHIKDYTELLLPIDILADGGFVSMLNDTDFINDEDYESPELIGWLYQFYISERKDEVMAKRGKYTPDEIPAATQIFTPNWIVKYMVQNTVGRIYLDNNPDAADELKPQWRYLVENPDDSNTDHVLHCDLQNMKVADLACGSGHILNECFDLLFDLYVTEGYSRRQAVECIFANNLTGVDIDTRAKQLATFALLLKACQKDPSFTDAHIMPNVLDMPHVDNYTWQDLGGHLLCALEIRDWIPEVINPELNDCFKLMEHADSLGSIMKFNISPATRDFIILCINEQKRQQKYVENFAELFKGFELILALTEKYHAIVMNPPYMGGSSMNVPLSEYVKHNYNSGKNDLCTVFILTQSNLTIEKGLYGFITPPSWMFLSTFEELRRYVIESQSISSLLHLSRGVFGADFGSVSAVVKNFKNTQARGTYFRLTERTFQEFEQKHLRILFEKTIENHDFKYCFSNYSKDIEDVEYNSNGNRIYYSNVVQNNFKVIPGFPIGYWLSETVLSIFRDSPKLSSHSPARIGMMTTDNNRFLRNWPEVSYHKFTSTCDSIENSIISNRKWFPYNKGGGFRKWYGMNELVVNWENGGKEIVENGMTSFRGKQFYFKKGITWSRINSGDFGVRFKDEGAIFDIQGSSSFPDDNTIFYVIAFMNSCVVKSFIQILNPTSTFQGGNINSLPFILAPNLKVDICTQNNINISRSDWNAHETSWDFQTNELIDINEDKYIHIMHDYGEWIGAMVDLAPPHLESLQWRVGVFHTRWETMFERLHANEEELNRQFIDIYGLQDELTPDVPLDKVTILQQGEVSIEDGELVWHDDVLMKQFISYAIGCMMGRYSIDKPGLILANQGDGLKEYEAQVPNSRFEVDDDGIIPLMPSDTWFNDNATLRFKRFVATVFGEEMLNENLNFIEQSLGKSIDHYFVKDFWKDHKKMYQNRPIYWLFSSKKGAFQCLVYMHRMNAYTAERIRSKYLLPHIEWLVQKTQELEDMPLLNTQDRRTLDNLHSQIAECREYHDRLHVIADRQIDFDLDDGVVVNYAKFGDTLAKLK